MKTVSMKTSIALLLVSALLLTRCGNFLHDLIPRERYPSRPVSPWLVLVIDGSSGTFILPTNNAWPYDWTIDWGDGVIETRTGTGAVDAGISHTYAPKPEYTIKITANSNTGHAAFGFYTGTNGPNATANKDKLLKALGHIKENTSVAVFPDAWRSCFTNCTNLNEVSPDLLPNVDNGTSSIFSGMFRSCTSLASLPAGFKLPAVPNGTSAIFSGMFNICSSLASLPPGFQLPAVPNGTSDIFLGMFALCSFSNTNIEDLIGPNIFLPGQQDNSNFMQGTFSQCGNLTGSASRALSMGLYGNTATPPPVPSSDFNTFKDCTALSDYSSLHANWK